MNISAETVVGSFRNALPTHFTFKITSFSNLATSPMKKYKSNVFDAGGYKWKLIFYPNGNSTDHDNEENHISMYLKMEETSALPPGWVADVFFRFFVLDRIRDKYLILGDTGGRTRRFHEMMTVWGDSQLLPLTTLNDSANGYLVDDTCIFVAEVFPCKNIGIGDCLTMVQFPSCVKHEWKIENFSSIGEETLFSEVFTAGDHKWKITLYPKGQPAENKEYLSLFLELDYSVALTPGEKVYAGFKLCLRDQLHNLHRKAEGGEKHKLQYYTSTTAENIVGSSRDALPTHFSFKISSFSLLATSPMNKYDSNEFDAGGYKWKLLFYPNGNSTDNGENHISMYLEMVETGSLPPGWVCSSDMGGRTRRFHEMMNVWGDSQLLPLTTLKDSANGYLVDDTCIFGAEVFICKNTGIGDCLTMVQSPSCVIHEWKIENFSSIREETFCSEVFTAGDHTWKIKLCPKGLPSANKEYLSLFLDLDNSVALTPGEKVYAGLKLRLRDQLHNLHKIAEGHRWFRSGLFWSWGLEKLIKVVELNDQTKGFLVNDTCIVEAEVTVCGVVKKLSSP